MSRWGDKKPRGANHPGHKGKSGLMGKLFVQQAATGELFDRTKKHQGGGPRKRVALPEALAKFFKPIGEL